MPHDFKLWCEDCQKGYEGECEKHGPLTHVSDTEVGTKARRSLPHLLELKEGKIRTGVFAREKLAKRLQFGPLQGLCVKESKKQLQVEEEIRNRYGIVYKLVQENEDLFLLDTRYEEHSNWMIFVRPAERKSDQNLVAFQYKGEIFFATIKEVAAQSELKVWFSRDYAERMGARVLSDDGSSWQFRTRQRFNCLGCGVVFSSAASLTNHRCSKIKQKKSEALTSRKKVKKVGITSESPASEAPVTPSRIELYSIPGEETVEEPSTRRISEKSLKSILKKEQVHEQLRSKELKSSDSSETEEESQEVKTPVKGNYQCQICEKVFHSPGKLKQHSYSHTGERPFSCPHCQKAFSSRFKLGRHQLIHTGERQHRCHVCNRSFHRKDHLKNHIQIHDPNKQFKCERPDCGKEYNSYMSYRKHCAVHAAEEGDLECKICLEMFDNKSDLIYHLKVHVGTRTVKSPSEKKFQCDQCERRFFTRKDVKRHLVVHTGKRDFVCSLCPQKFGRKDHLVRHIKKSHGVSDPSRLESFDPLAVPGPSSAPQALSPEAAALSSTSPSSGDQSLSSLLIGEPIAGPSVSVSTKLYSSVPLSQPQEIQYSGSSFPSEFKFIEEEIKEEPDLTASMESIGAGGDDITKILGMYLPTGSINLPVPPLTEQESSQLQEENLGSLDIGQREAQSIPALLIRGGTIFEEGGGTSLPILPVSSCSSPGGFSQIPVESYIGTASSTSSVQQVPLVHSSSLLAEGFRGLLEESVGNPRTVLDPTAGKETSQPTHAIDPSSIVITSPPNTLTTSESATIVTTTTTVTITTTSDSGSVSSLPGFDQAFP